MFEITDEFLEKAGLGALSHTHKENARREITDSVQKRITEAIAMRTSEEEADELERVMDGDMKTIRAVAAGLSGNYRHDSEFLAVQRLGGQSGASDDDILAEYVKIAWFKAHNIDIIAVVKEAMESVLASLQQIHAQVSL